MRIAIPIRQVWLLTAVLAFFGDISPAVQAQENPAVLEITIHKLTNTYRAQNGRDVLILHPGLAKAAQKHAKTLAQLEMISGDVHNVNGTTPLSRARQEGYNGPNIGENVQANLGCNDPAAAALNWWKGSPVHNQNLLSANYSEIGVGAARSNSGRWFLVQMFGTSPAKGGGSDGSLMKRVDVRIENHTKHDIAFSIEGNSHVMKPNQWGTYWHQKVGPVQYSYSWKSVTSPGGGAGAGILENNQKYAFIQTGSTVTLQVIGQLN